MICAPKRIKIAISAYFDPKIESSELGAKNAFIVTTGLISSRKMFLNCFQSIFFRKKVKNYVFSLVWSEIRCVFKNTFRCHFFGKFHLENTSWKSFDTIGWILKVILRFLRILIEINLQGVSFIWKRVQLYLLTSFYFRFWQSNP